MRPYAVLIIARGASAAQGCLFHKKKPAPVVQITQPQSESALSLEEIEQRHIIDVLNKNNGNRAATAKELGISLRKLYYRLGEYQKKGLVSDAG